MANMFEWMHLIKILSYLVYGDLPDHVTLTYAYNSERTHANEDMRK